MKQHHSKQREVTTFQKLCFFARVLILNLLCVRFWQQHNLALSNHQKDPRQTKTVSLGAKFTIVCLPPIYWRQQTSWISWDPFNIIPSELLWIASDSWLSRKVKRIRNGVHPPPSHPLRQIWTFIAN